MANSWKHAPNLPRSECGIKQNRGLQNDTLHSSTSGESRSTSYIFLVYGCYEVKTLKLIVQTSSTFDSSFTLLAYELAKVPRLLCKKRLHLAIRGISPSHQIYFLCRECSVVLPACQSITKINHLVRKISYTGLHSEQGLAAFPNKQTSTLKMLQ